MNCKILGYAALSSVLLLFSYFVYAWSLLMFFGGLLIPYDVVFVEMRPPVGTVTRDVNDYFETHDLIWMSVVLVCSLVVLVVSVIRGKKFSIYRVLNHFSVLNCFWGACVMIFSIVGRLISNSDYNLIGIFGGLLSLFLVWYLQVSLFFIKPKLITFEDKTV